MRWSTLYIGRAAASAIVVLLLAHCSGENGPSVSSSDPLRIISLSPAISRTLVDFGLGERVVGRTQFCESLAPTIPVVGSLMDANYEAIIRLSPTHILVQPAATGVDPELKRLTEEHGWVLGQWPAMNTVDDIETMVLELPGILHKQESAGYRDATVRAAELVNVIAAALRPEPSAWHGSVLIAYSTEPVGAFGHETYLHDVLVRCGATNAVPGAGWVTLSLEDVTLLDPEAIILVKPGAEDGASLGPLAALEVRATRDNRLAVLRSEDAMLPSTGIVTVAEELRQILHDFREGEQ